MPFSFVLKSSFTFLMCLVLSISQGVSQENIQSKFKTAWEYYKVRAEQGASPRERLHILNQIETKYMGRGLDLDRLKHERKKYLSEERKFARYSGDIFQSEPPQQKPIQRDQNEKKYSTFAHIEYLTKSNAFEEDEDALQSFDLASRGYGVSSSADSSISDGMGARFGLKFKGNSVDFGGSVGYVSGPRREMIMTTTNLLTFTEMQIEGTQQTTFFRFLYHIWQDIPLSKQSLLRLGTGLGYAIGDMKSKMTLSDSFFSIDSASASTSEKWAGLAWEITPSFLVKTHKLAFEVGFGYAGFPAMSETNEFFGFAWNPRSIRLGLEF